MLVGEIFSYYIQRLIVLTKYFIFAPMYQLFEAFFPLDSCTREVRWSQYVPLTLVFGCFGFNDTL